MSESFKWENWHKTINVGGPVQEILQPHNGETLKNEDIQQEKFKPGLKRLLEIVENAMKNEGHARIRAFGSKWSLNNAAYTKEYMVETWGLNYSKIGLDKDMVVQGYKNKAEKLCFVQAGVMIHHLNAALADENLVLKTTGASDGQRLIGAISTGTHGSAIHVGAMQDFVKGIHLVIPDGDSDAKHIFLQRESDQAVNANFASFLDNTELIYDDKLFNAAVVGFGCFGLIHGLLIETEDRFKLRYQTVRFNPYKSNFKENDEFEEFNAEFKTVLSKPTRENLRALAQPGATADLFSWLDEDKGYPYFFSVSINPYRAHLNPRTFFIKVMEKVPFPKPRGLSPEEEAIYTRIEQHEAMYEGFRELEEDEQPRGTRILSKALQLGLKRFHSNSVIPKKASNISANKVDEKLIPEFPYNIFTSKNSRRVVTKAPCPATSTEIAVPLSQVNEAIECILKVLQKNLLAAPLSVRYLPKSSATLAVNQYEELTVTIELPGPQKGECGLCSKFPDSKPAHKAIFEALKKSEIPHRYHWGQQLPMNTDWVTESYGADKVKAWKDAREKILTTDRARNLFANKLTDAIGLT